MRHASASLLALLLASAALGCAAPRAQAVAEADARVQPAAQRGAELYGRYCTGCHAAAARTARSGRSAPWLMHVQARLAMGSPAWAPEALTRADARLIADYLDRAGAER
jgi:mono/diheme cytochrome c family protein